MALGGGNFTAMNKILPGSYINIVSMPRPSNIFGDRGYAALALDLNWGPNEIITIEPAELQTESLEIFGYSYSDPEMLPIRELMTEAKVGYIGRLNGDGTKSTATNEGLTITAKYAGTRGNDISVAIKENIDSLGSYKVETRIAGILVDEQEVSAIEELEGNKFVDFTGTGELTAAAGIRLEGGSNSEVKGENHSEFLEELEKYYFNTVGTLSTESTIKKLYSEYATRLRDSEGVKVQAVVLDFEANHEGTINVMSETETDPAGFIPWVTGAEAGCPINRSLTNRRYNGEHKINTSYKQRELEAATIKGHFMLHKVGDELRVLTDINSFTEFSVDKNSDFAQNQVIRVVDEVAMSGAKIFNNIHLGKTQNDQDGRIALWNDFVSHAQTMQDLRAIEDFEPEHIEVQRGPEKDIVVVDYLIQPVMAMQKLYMTVRIAA